MLTEPARYQKIRIDIEGDTRKIAQGLRHLYDLGLKIQVVRE